MHACRNSVFLLIMISLLLSGIFFITCPYNLTSWGKMLIRRDLLTVRVPWKHLVLNFRLSAWQKKQTGWKMLSTAMFVYKNLRLEAVPPHLVYIIKFFVAHQIVYSHSIPVHISDISLAENRKLTQKIWEMGLNCLSLRISRKCDSHEMIELDQTCSSQSLFYPLT